LGSHWVQGQRHGIEARHHSNLPEGGKAPSKLIGRRMTHRQKETYDFIRKFWQEHGLSPTYREIATAIGSSGAYSIVAALEERNWVRVGYRNTPTASARAIIPIYPRAA
jgi:hypothetical protein